MVLSGFAPEQPCEHPSFLWIPAVGVPEPEGGKCEKVSMSAESTSVIQASLSAALEETLEEVLMLSHLVAALGEISELELANVDTSAVDLH